MPTYKLTYFDAPTSRGEECRLALTIAGVPFEDERLKTPEFAARRASTPFGALPVLTIEGKGELAQSNAILGYIGAHHGLLPEDPWQAARHIAVLGAVEDLRGRLRPVTLVKEEPRRTQGRKEFAATYLPEWASFIEKQIGDGPFLGGARISVADIKLFVATGTILRGGIDHIPAEVFSGAPKLLRLVEAVKNHPRVTEWYARR